MFSGCDLIFGQKPDDTVNYDEKMDASTGKWLLMDEEDTYFVFDGSEGVMTFSYYEDGDYYAACMGFAQTCESLLQDNAQSKGGFPVGLLFIALIAGAVLSFLIPMSVMKGQLKTVAPKAAAADYVRQGSMNLRVERDLFLYRNVSRIAKPKNNASGTHRSSSGRSHGGGRL